MGTKKVPPKKVVTGGRYYAEVDSDQLTIEVYSKKGDSHEKVWQIDLNEMTGALTLTCNDHASRMVVMPEISNQVVIARVEY